VLFRGNAEAFIRTQLVRSGILKGIIGLPANLFYGTGIPACILVLDKENATARKGIFMIDASKGFKKDGPKNRLREQDLHKIVDTFTKGAGVEGYSRLVPFAEIEKNDFNLNLPRYIDNREAEDIQDIEAHLKGGIPIADVEALADYWRVCPGLKKSLFTDNRPGYVDLMMETGDLKEAIHSHSEFAAFVERTKTHFTSIREALASSFRCLRVGCHPKEFIHEYSEKLLAHYRGQPLLDEYAVYQHLMDYWAETMQDDVYLIAADGWKAEPTRILVEDKKGKIKDKGWTCDLVPKALVVARYFAKEQAAIEAQEAELESVTAQLTELEEEHGGEDGAFSELEKINKAEVARRLKEIGRDASPRRPKDDDSAEEEKVLKQWTKLNKQEAALKAAIKDAEAVLDAAAYAKYAELDEDAVKTLVVDDKWLATYATSIHGEIDRISQTLTGRIRELAERYATPLPELSSRVAELETKVAAHLAQMGHC